MGILESIKKRKEMQREARIESYKARAQKMEEKAAYSQRLGKQAKRIEAARKTIATHTPKRQPSATAEKARKYLSQTRIAQQNPFGPSAFGAPAVAKKTIKVQKHKPSTGQKYAVVGGKAYLIASTGKKKTPKKKKKTQRAGTYFSQSVFDW